MSDGIPEEIPPEVHKVPAVTRRGWRGAYALHGREVPGRHVSGSSHEILAHYDDVREIVRAGVYQATGDRDAAASAARLITLELARQGRLR